MSSNSIPCIPIHLRIARPPLPNAMNPEGRPVWEPPVFCYDHLIDEKEYEKKRESVMKYTSNNVVRTTKIMDLRAEKDVLWMYTSYLNTAIVDSQPTVADSQGVGCGHRENVGFYEVLWKEVFFDFENLHAECEEDDVSQLRHEDGTWETTEVVWETKDSSTLCNSGDYKPIDPYILAHNTRLAEARKDFLPLPEILVPDELDPDLAGPTWDFQPLQVDIALPDVMCMIYQGKLEAVYSGREEVINDVEDVD